MKTKKSKHEETSSESDTDSTESDSSSSGSDSSDSSPPTKKSKKETDINLKKQKDTKSKLADEEHKHSKKSRSHIESDERINKIGQNIIEKSKWDSPKEGYKRKDKKSEKYRRSNSVEQEHSRSVTEREDDSNRSYNKTQQNDKPRDYYQHRHDRRPGRYGGREEYNNRYENHNKYEDRERYDNYRDKNKRDRMNRRDDNADKRYKNERYSSNDQDKYKSESNSRNRRRRSRSSSFNHAEAKWGKEDDEKVKSDKPKDKEKPNFALSGKLTEETNTYRGVVIKYSEPPEARKPKRRWRLYPFKGEKALQTLYIHRESAYLVGRERKVVDLPVDHPSCSKQHAVLQYRLVPFVRDDGSQGKRVRPYLIDLDSANGTFINNKKIDSKKYVELLEKDVIKFGYSSREYVLLHENSKDEAQDDDVKDEEVTDPPIKKEKEKE